MHHIRQESPWRLLVLLLGPALSLMALEFHPMVMRQAVAQEAPPLPNVPSQLVEAVTVDESETQATVRVEGLLDPSRFGQIFFNPVDSSLTMALEIPGAGVGVELQESQEFEASPWLEEIETSWITVPDAPDLGQVTIVLELTPGTTARLNLEDSDATGLQILLERPLAASSQRPPQVPEPASGPVPPKTPASGPADPSSAMDAENTLASPEDTAQALHALKENDPRLRLAPWKSRPTLVRLAILNASGIPGQASKVAVLFMDIKRVYLERTVGMRVEVANISNAASFNRYQTLLSYRPEYLRAALQIAKLLPGEQTIEPMGPELLDREGLDVILWLGKDIP